MDSQNNLINLGELSKPIDTLIIKISDAIGVLYEPRRIIKAAEATAKAKEIELLSRIKLDSIENRALNRLIHEESIKQNNIEAVIENSLPFIDKDAIPENIENDWLIKFFEHAKFISDEEMRNLWSYILAEEANSPGKISKRVLNIVSELDKSDAVMFLELCKFIISGDDYFPAVVDIFNPIYNDKGLNFESLSHLENIGLINFDSLSGYVITDSNSPCIFKYFDDEIIVDAEKNNNRVSIGHVVFTKAGESISRIVNVEPDHNINQYLRSYWIK